jgi:hypothetical protein
VCVGVCMTVFGRVCVSVCQAEAVSCV